MAAHEDVYRQIEPRARLMAAEPGLGPRAIYARLLLHKLELLKNRPEPGRTALLSAAAVELTPESVSLARLVHARLLEQQLFAEAEQYARSGGGKAAEADVRLELLRGTADALLNQDKHAARGLDLLR